VLASCTVAAGGQKRTGDLADHRLVISYENSLRMVL